MDGSGIDFVIMPVIILPCLIVWLGGIYYVAAHPTWKNAPSAGPPAAYPETITVISQSGPATVPASGTATAVPGPRAAQREAEATARQAPYSG